jgi:hypothetical protein
MKRLFGLKTAWALALVLALTIFTGSALAEPWKFGVMCDTQWPNSPDGKNPNVAVNVIRHLNQEFINKGVKFVVQVGDLTDTAGTNNVNLDIRATFAQDLYNAGIGFYPLRGNHESGASAAVRFQQIFPQTQTGVNNQTPNMVSTTIYGPQENTNGTFTIGTTFASEPGLEGLTYSFDYDNARFVLIDQFTKPDGTSHSNLNATDVDWVGTQLSTRPANTHAFVFAHKGLITENHNDNLFGSNPDASSTVTNLTNSFMSYLQNNGVRYHMGGHDHMHNRAIVTSPDGLSEVQNIIAASNSYKFYIPPTMTTFNTQTWRSRETQVSQELFTVGYYIFTVDGPKVTVDYYAMPNGCNGDCDQTYDVIPYYNPSDGTGVPFTRHETFGYSLNGKDILVPQGGSYVLTDDTGKAVANGETGYISTTAAILGGTNSSTGKDYNNRALTKAVDTGWAPKDNAVLASDILTLWGMADSLATNFTDANNSNYHYLYVVPNTTLTDTYALSMTYDPDLPEHLGNGGFGIATKDAHGNWINAVDMNFGGTKSFVMGPWKEGYALGTYGVDPSTKTAWAVINYNASFAVANGIEPVPGHRK